MEGKFLNPKADLTFKKVFGEHEDVVMSRGDAAEKERRPLAAAAGICPESHQRRRLRYVLVHNMTCIFCDSKKLLIITILAAILSMSVSAQQRITVKDGVNREPIAYTSVWFGNEAGGYTDESGMITIPEGVERMRLSHICYETKNISCNDVGGDVVLLAPKNIGIREICVTAKAPKRMKTATVGLMKEKTRTCHRGANGFELALFIPYDSTWVETPYIHSILASLDYSTHWLTFTTIKTPIYATLRFDLRLPNEETKAPRDESIINGGIIIQSGQRVGKEGVKLSNPIPFPKAGVFVVIEWITTATVSESQSLLPALNMTLKTNENQTWNKKTFRSIDWMREQDEPIYQEETARELYKDKIPCAKLGLEISR